MYPQPATTIAHMPLYVICSIALYFNYISSSAHYYSSSLLCNTRRRFGRNCNAYFSPNMKAAGMSINNFFSPNSVNNIHGYNFRRTLKYLGALPYPLGLTIKMFKSRLLTKYVNLLATSPIPPDHNVYYYLARCTMFPRLPAPI